MVLTILLSHFFSAYLRSRHLNLHVFDPVLRVSRKPAEPNRGILRFFDGNTSNTQSSCPQVRQGERPDSEPTGRESQRAFLSKKGTNEAQMSYLISRELPHLQGDKLPAALSYRIKNCRTSTGSLNL